MGHKIGGNRRLGSRQGGDGDLGTFLQERGRNETEGGKREKISCWKISAAQNPPGAGTHLRGFSSCPPRGWRIKFQPRTNTGAPKQGGRAQPVPCPCHPWEPSQPLLILLPNRFRCSSSQDLENLGGKQPQDLEGLREMGIFLPL